MGNVKREGRIHGPVEFVADLKDCFAADDNGVSGYFSGNRLHTDRCQGILRLEIGNVKRKFAGSFVFDANIPTGIGKRESLDHA